MKALVVYDSQYGNTEKIAAAIGGALEGEVKVVRAEAAAGDLGGLDLLIVGAPTHGGRPTPATIAFLDKIPADGLKGVKCAAFDTRLSSKFARVFGYAAPKIADALAAKGGQQISPPEGFIVKGSKGPLGEGEIERAAAWGKSIFEKSGKT